MSVCATCGHDSPPEFRFCPACGSALAAIPARELRKLVTVVFCDLSGSTALGDRTDPETLRATMRGYYEEMRAILERHGGTVEKFVGDAVMAVFGVPLAHEDDALRAVRAAWEMRGAVARLGLQARIGVNTGEVVAGDGDSLVTGDTVNVAARLEQAADTGEVLIGAQTRRLVRDAVQVEPVEVVAKGKPEPLSAFRLVHLDLGAAGVARHLETALVGRMRELALLRQAYERAVGERSCYLFTLLGSAGVGKSRLIEEFLGGVPARVARGRCLGYGDGITLWPVIEVLKQLGAEETIEQLTHATAAASELFWNVRLALEHAAEAAPLVVVFDDIHWAEPAFLDLIDHVADLSRGVPLLVLCAARTELLDARPGWGGGKLNAASALLGPLTEAESAELIGAQAAGIDAVTREQIATAAGGNPFFVEEMLALAREGGDIRAPSTIQALLQARLDLLATGERSVIERGAVEGEIFHRSALERLANGSPVDSHLISLVRKELIRPERSTFPGEDAFRFRHLLIRDAAYEALPKETRAELHEHFAEWLEARGGLIELDEILGYHLEQANRYRQELGKPDDGLAARAGRLLAAAGCRAFAREDIAAASSLLERALSLLPSGDDARPAAALALAELVAGRGEFGRHDELVAPLLNWPDRRVRAHARMVDAGTRFTREPEGGSDTIRGLLRELVPELEASADIEGLMRAAMLEFWPTVMACDGAAGTAALLRAIAYARQLGDRRTEGIATQYLAPVAGIGSASATELERLVAELSSGGEHGPLVECGIHALACCAAFCRGRFDEARAEVERAIVILREELGWHLQAVAFDMIAAVLERHAEVPTKVVERLEPSARQLLDFGMVAYASTQFAMLAQAQYELGDRDAALASATRCEELTASDDIINFAIVNGVRARIAADGGDGEQARTLAERALEWALKSDWQIYRGDAYRDLAHVRRAAGDLDGARAALLAALAEYRAKEDAPLVDKTEALLTEL